MRLLLAVEDAVDDTIGELRPAFWVAAATGSLFRYPSICTPLASR